MGQGEVFQFLKENEGQIFTNKDICMALGIGNAASALFRLRRYPPEGFNFSKEYLVIDKKRYDNAWSFRRKTYIYWYKK